MGYIQLTVDRKPIGRIEFDVVSDKDGIVNVTNVNLPDHKSLRREIILQLTTNRKRFTITGGLAPKRIGRYSDGIVSVLVGLQSEFKFEFDPQYLPIPVLPPGSIS